MTNRQSAWERILINIVAPVTAAAALGMCALAFDLSESIAAVQAQIADIHNGQSK